MAEDSYRRKVSNSLWLGAALLLILLLPAAARAEGGTSPVQWQNVAVTLEPERHSLVGGTTIIYSPGRRMVRLRLSESATVEKVESEGKGLAYSFSGGVISCELPAGAGRVPVTVSYRATFNDTVSTHPAAGEDPSYGVNGAITREATFLGDGAFWYPVPSEVPLRRSLNVAAPAGMEAISYGRRVSHQTVGNVTRSVWEESRPVGALSLCAGYYRIEERRIDGIDLYSYLYPGNASLAPRYLDAAARYLTFYRDLFGPYPFEKFAVVENFFPTGYGFPSFTLLGGSVIRLPFIIDTSFPHEIAHSWWGNGIQPDPREGNWSEGLVTYLADYLLKERRSAVEAREYRKQLLIDYASLVTPGNDFSLTAFESRSDPASRAIGYGKGAMVFHMIRSRIGDAAFFNALRQVAREHMYGSASWSDFARAFSRSSGTDLTPFIQQWLGRPGGPRLSLADVSTRREGKGWLVTGSILQSSPYYQLRVPLRVQTERGKVEEVVAVKGERTPFAIATDSSPGRLLLDPDADVFRILSPAEIPATVNSIKGSSSLIGVVTRTCRAQSGTFRTFLASLSQERAPVVGEEELDPREEGKHDLVFCGLPQDKALLPPLPEEIELSSGGFTYQGHDYRAPDAMLLTVLQQPRSPGRFAALFLPLSQEAAERYLAKVTHYGKYGNLVFSGGSIREKGTAAAADRGVAVDLRR